MLDLDLDLDFSRLATRRQILQWLAALGATVAAAPAYGVGIEPNLAPHVVSYDVRPPGWPEKFNLSIAVIADLHACKPWMEQERIAEIVTRTNAIGADLIVLLGDYVASHRFITGRLEPAEWAEPLKDLRAPLGVHAVLGNHDWWQDETVQHTGEGPPASKGALEAVGIPVYENEAVRITKNGQAFWLAGLGDQLAYQRTRKPPPNHRDGADDLPGTLALVTDDAPVILMAHEPDVIMRVPDRISLTLCGHTHGGQVRLFGWSPVVPSDYGNRFAYGHICEPRDIVVSGGLGCSIMPLRFGMPPEIVLVRVGSRSAAVPAV
jgi:predicted MPP superfamily phosphohydrolase